MDGEGRVGIKVREGRNVKSEWKRKRKTEEYEKEPSQIEVSELIPSENINQMSRATQNRLYLQAPHCVEYFSVGE